MSVHIGSGPAGMFFTRTETGRYLRSVALIALAFFLSAKFAFALVQLNSEAKASVLFPPIGISLAGLILWGQRTWVGVAIGAIWFGRSLSGVSWLAAFGSALGNTLEVVIAADLLKRINFDRSLHRVRDVIALVTIAAGFSTAINATIATLNGYFAGIVPTSAILNNWFVIWLGDAVSILVLTPALLVLGTRPFNLSISIARLKSAWKDELFRRRTVEFTVWLGLLVICSWIVLSDAFHQVPSELEGIVRSLIQYLPFLFIVWAALRLGHRGTVLSALMLSLISIWAVAQDQHYFVGANRANLQSTLFQLQAFIGVMTTTALVLAATIAERQKVEDLLRNQIRRDRLLAESTLRIRQSLDLRNVLNTTVAEVRQFLNADRVYIGRFDLQGYADVVAESVATGWQPMLGTQSPRAVLEDVKAVFAQNSVRVISDTSTIKKNEFLHDYYELYKVKASLSIPLVQDGQYFGVLNVNQCSAPRQWQDGEIELLERLATQVELAIQQGCLYEQVQNFATDLEQQVQERTEQLQHNMEELRSLNEVKDTLLHAVTHDLRTPVIGMLMVLKRLQTKSKETVTMPRSTLDRIIESGDRQLNLIKSLLEDYSPGVQELVLNYQSVAFQNLVRETLQDLEPLLSQNRVHVNNWVPENLPTITADPIHIRRVLENLITNAMKHNPPQTTITVQAEVINQDVKCTIADDGIGMTQEQCDQLFRKPYLRRSHSRHQTGLGLGLFLCHQIITAHHGQIGVTSAPNVGTKFWFRVPIRSS